MNKPSQADLLGYLLGVLEPSEQRIVERALESDDRLKSELDSLEQKLSAMESPALKERPPTDLARHTSDFIATLPMPQPVETANSQIAGASFSNSRHDQSNLIKSWSVTDIVVACCVCLVISMIFLPALAHSRFQANITTCQNNLRVIGVSLENYADNYLGQLIPIPTTQPYGVAGIYAVQLRDDEWIAEDDVFFCPSSKPIDGLGKRIPTRNEIVSATGIELRSLLQQLGGDYAYTLGSIEKGSYRQPRLAVERSHQVLLGDAPDIESPGLRSANHLNKGQNILTGDFSTKYILTCTVAPGDNIYQNDRGVIAPGTHVNDSVLGSSAISPF